jgi:hypothetical protein
MTMKLRRAAALLLGILLAAACSDSTGSDDAPRPGTFRGSLSCDVSGSFNGTALVFNNDPEQVLAIYLADDRVPSRTTTLTLVAPSPPAPGTYRIGTPLGIAPFGAQLHVFDAATGEASLALTGLEGTVTIDKAGGVGMRGSFDVTLQDGPVAGPRTTARATGRFSAAPVSVD